jgi:ketosteroid isomerase-like protein
MEGLSVPQGFKLVDGIGRARVEFYLRDRRSGHSHSGTFSQALHYRDGRISRMEEYHDAAALAAFMSLLKGGASAS